MRRLFLILVAFILSHNFVSGQSISNPEKWNIKVGYAKYGIAKWIVTTTSVTQLKDDNIRIELNHKLVNTIDAGVYIGYSKFRLIDSVADEQRIHTPFYGVNCNVHLLPYLINHDSRFDLYLTAKFGGYYFMSPPNFYMRGSRVEYGLGVGLTYNVLKNIGLYCDYSWGKYFFNDVFKLRYGLSVKF